MVKSFYLCSRFQGEIRRDGKSGRGGGKKTFKKRALGIWRIRKREYLCSPFRSGERGKRKGKRSLEK